METIYELFTASLGAAPQDETLHELPIHSPCGEACKSVIDAAKALLEASDCSMHADIRRVTADAVSVYWRG